LITFIVVFKSTKRGDYDGERTTYVTSKNEKSARNIFEKTFGKQVEIISFNVFKKDWKFCLTKQ